MANVSAICGTWKASTKQGEARISEALAVYIAREQLTETFIAKYYRVVLAEVKSLMDGQSLPRFSTYMDDRRRGLANAGMTS